MLVEFLQDYRGKLTQEAFFRAGEIGDFPADVAERLITDRRAVYAGESDLAPGELPAGLTAELIELEGDGEGEALPPVTDDAKERSFPGRRRGKKAQE